MRLILLLCLSLFHTQVQADIKITDTYGTHHFQAPPQRVVALNWDILEQVLALDVVPVAAPNLSGYNYWVKQPLAPESISDIGTRSEPNLEKIARLNPDVILAASPQQELIPLLRLIAPVIYLPNFSKEQDAAATAIAHFRTLGKLFNKQALAEEKLAELDAAFNRLRDKIAAHYFSNPADNTHQSPSLDVVVMRFSTPNSIFLYSENSSTAYVTRKLGLTNPVKVAPRAWGIKQERINRLQNIRTGYVLYVLPFPEEGKLKESRLWQAMPFVQNRHINSVRTVWSYGGAMSLRYMAEAITDSLIELAPNQ